MSRHLSPPATGSLGLKPTTVGYSLPAAAMAMKRIIRPVTFRDQQRLLSIRKALWAKPMTATGVCINALRKVSARTSSGVLQIVICGFMVPLSKAHTFFFERAYFVGQLKQRLLVVEQGLSGFVEMPEDLVLRFGDLGLGDGSIEALYGLNCRLDAANSTADRINHYQASRILELRAELAGLRGKSIA